MRTRTRQRSRQRSKGKSKSKSKSKSRSSSYKIMSNSKNAKDLIKKYIGPYIHADLWYGPREKHTVSDPHKKIYKTRKTGRLGNMLFEYMFWYLMTCYYGGTFKNIYEPFPKPFDKLPNTFTINKHDEVFKYLNFSNYHELIPGYPMNFKYYSHSRKLLKSLLNIETFTKKYDIVIHVRLDDVFDDSMAYDDYTVLPFSFYDDVFKVIKKQHGSTCNFKILLIGRTIDSFQEKVLEDLTQFIRKVSGSKDVNKQTGTVTEDMTAIMSSPILIGSTSSFWCWPSFLSNICTEIHIPVFGQTHIYHYFEGPDAIIKITKNYIMRELPNDNYRIYGYLLRTNRIRQVDIALMYDR